MNAGKSPKQASNQSSLFDPPERKKGPTRLAYERQVRRLHKGGTLDGRAETLLELCRGLADAMDLARVRKDPYAATAVARELRESLVALEPHESDDGLNAFLEQLRAPMGDTSPA